MDPVSVTRSSAKEAYHDTAATRQNFHLLAENHVTHIITEVINGIVKVTGVEVRSLVGNPQTTIKLKRYV
jgi:hypothetical protein